MPRSFILLTLIAAPILFLSLDTPAFMDHEGRYAEVAREMLLLRDWVTPHLNFTIFLNKPPLSFWLTALTFKLVGVSEYARLYPAVMGLATLWVTFFLGKALGDVRSGVLSAGVLLTSAGFFLESRTLRPDMLLVLLVSLALCGFVKALAAPKERSRTLWVGLSAFSLALSVMTKGLVGVVLVGGTVLAVLLFYGRLSFLRQVRWAVVLAVFLVVVLPWHLLAGFTNEGFWWDYVVNQHLLFSFDRKLPRDSQPDSLLICWGAFLGRTFPWSVFLPVALWRAFQVLRSRRTPGTLLPVVWLGVVLAFFSLVPSRLEHYSLPALPAVALLVGGWWAEKVEKQGDRSASGLVCCTILALLAGVSLVLVPRVVEAQSWAKGFPELAQPVPVVFGILILGAGAALWSFWQRRPRLAFAFLGLTMIPQFFFIHQALRTIEPVNSWKGVAISLCQLLPPNGEVIFAASEEYQMCAGLNFYSGRPLLIWLPEGYVPPTYLPLQNQTAFLTQEEFLRHWQGKEPVLLVVDPERGVKEPEALVPGPVKVVERWGDRLLLANEAFVLSADADKFTK
jgi:4-amino-4-deoxy-L-arabinose transferase-like glycosyltransferase